MDCDALVGDHAALTVGLSGSGNPTYRGDAIGWFYVGAVVCDGGMIMIASDNDPLT